MGATAAQPGSRPDGSRQLAGSPVPASIPSAASAINVEQGLFMDVDGTVFPITNWFDEDGDECPRDSAVVAVAGRDGCWFSLVLADFCETGAQA